MNRKLLLVFVLWLTVLSLLHPQDAKEPNYKGKPLSYWLEDRNWHDRMLTSSEVWAPPALTAEQEMAVRHMGTNALPFLILWVSEFEQTNYNHGYSQVIQAFRVLGPSAKTAIPGLFRLVKIGRAHV